MGFRCCSAPTRVTRTVRVCVGRIVRYRKCQRCGRNLVTEERERAKRGTHAR